MVSKSVIAALVSATLVASCGSVPQLTKEQTGALIGGATGLLAGSQSNSNKRQKQILGTVAGAIAGASIGKRLDEQEAQLRAELAAEQSQRAVEVERVSENLLKLTLNGEVSFDTNSATVKPAFYGTLNKLASVLVNYANSDVLVIGHTDDRGSDEHNLGLSQRRAQSVAAYLSGQGVASERLIVEGRGEAEPRSSNDTSEGRAQNRRVEVFVRPRE